MSDELAKLRADLEVFERYGLSGYAWTVQKKIARLEAEQADPWREHRASVEFMRKTVYAAADVPKVVAYVDHLTAERERLAARVAELEAAAIRVDFENGVATLNPDALVLDPARVLATAVWYFRDHAPDYDTAWEIETRMPKDAKPYRLKGKTK